MKLHNLTAALACASLIPYCVALTRRADVAEHVVLADCRDGEGVQSSQMAYYNNSITSYPNSVAAVRTAKGQMAHWEGPDLISATFDSGVTFTANITTVVAQGQYAGTGENDYGSFTCWYNSTSNLYHWGNATCDEVYDCNHQALPVATNTVLSSSQSIGMPPIYALCL